MNIKEKLLVCPLSFCLCLFGSSVQRSRSDDQREFRAYTSENFSFLKHDIVGFRFRTPYARGRSHGIPNSSFTLYAHVLCPDEHLTLLCRSAKRKLSRMPTLKLIEGLGPLSCTSSSPNELRCLTREEIRLNRWLFRHDLSMVFMTAGYVHKT